MFQFNVNQDLKDPRMIAATIGAYDSPEAAISDFDANAPQGKDYLTKQYQRLTGDWFADPFKDAEKAGLTQRIQDAMAGNSFATGGGVPQLLTKFQPMMPMSPVAPVAPVSPIAPVSPLLPLQLLLHLWMLGVDCFLTLQLLNQNRFNGQQWMLR
jgi:hypothetical protein